MISRSTCCIRKACSGPGIVQFGASDATRDLRTRPGTPSGPPRRRRPARRDRGRCTCARRSPRAPATAPCRPHPARRESARSVVQQAGRGCRRSRSRRIVRRCATPGRHAGRRVPRSTGAPASAPRPSSVPAISRATRLREIVQTAARVIEKLECRVTPPCGVFGRRRLWPSRSAPRAIRPRGCRLRRPHRQPGRDDRRGPPR